LISFLRLIFVLSKRKSRRRLRSQGGTGNVLTSRPTRVRWRDRAKLEGSIFTGREPDQSLWDIETPKMDSQSVRLTFNPSDDWSFQVSYGHLNSPEQLEPDVDQDRITASATYNRPFGMNHEKQQRSGTYARCVPDRIRGRVQPHAHDLRSV
jgi:hypothetical protein